MLASRTIRSDAIDLFGNYVTTLSFSIYNHHKLNGFQVLLLCTPMYKDAKYMHEKIFFKLYTLNNKCETLNNKCDNKQ